MRFSKIAVFADLDNCRHSKTARRLPGGLGSGMKFARGTPEFNANMDAYFEMDECVPMTRKERILLRYWVRDGYDIETNPWKILEPDGSPHGVPESAQSSSGLFPRPLGFMGIC